MQLNIKWRIKRGKLKIKVWILHRDMSNMKTGDVWLDNEGYWVKLRFETIMRKNNCYKFGTNLNHKYYDNN